ncbi:MAG TPA: hypothetical protein VN736_08540, partial [Candidatus Limnocylindrales bacterium]|nr:hypothetical protein [Candidatus Limnocylindrales bacterium]
MGEVNFRERLLDEARNPASEPILGFPFVKATHGQNLGVRPKFKQTLESFFAPHDRHDHVKQNDVYCFM